MSEALGRRVARALAGDGEAIRWIYETYGPPLIRRLGARYGGFGLDAEDLLQDTFLYVLGHGARPLRRYLRNTPESQQSEASLGRFLWSAACGVASNRRRSVLRHPSSPLPNEELTGRPGGEGEAIARDALEGLARCLFRHSDRVYLYFQLRYRDGLKPAEIVQATGWSKKVTYKLKQSLDAALEKCLEELDLTS